MSSVGGTKMADEAVTTTFAASRKVALPVVVKENL